ncbi:APC membrane recruitment protein 1 [Alligator mississippiensis]|uniref:APC membrane recruitment protein 1 n=1 Tax=Alligator mississippiensis TaxID=8496 RepID=A0A151NNC1_ALLMI|nr:APC membrane recruitment protein 1 [Alligator mississippiensis]
METSCTEEAGRTSTPSVVCRHLEGGDPLQQEENGAADCLSERSDASAAAQEQQQQQAPPGKLKKTAFKLFGGKRSICTLPSFFGGKTKGQGKGASKKGLSKSKTHDGISDVACEDGRGGHLEGPLNGGTNSHPCQLPSSQSAHTAIDASFRFDFSRRESSPPGSTEGFEKKSNGDKSLSLPRPKKGLKGLFNSIRRHRKNKTAEPEKAGPHEWVGEVRDGEQTSKTRGTGAEPQRASEVESSRGDPLSAACTGNLVGNCCLSSSLREATESEWLVAEKCSLEGNGAVAPVSKDCVLDMKSEVEAIVCAEPGYSSLPDVLHSDYIENDPPSEHSGDQLSLMFGDVTSLKSFDSLTGCGDIIAEPDIESIAESTISVERSRDAAKRSSCLVTYQGGGEEMAMPEEIEEYLHQMWEGTTEVDSSYEASLPHLMNSHEPQGVNSKLEAHGLCMEGAHPYTGGVVDDVELLTPQSDQQESAPNSDEGYYDSTTPGPEDEAGDGLGEGKKDRLPRDSYSGDALYEFYEPDDTLMSPSQGDESLFEGKASHPDIFSCFLDFTLPAEKNLMQLAGQKNRVMETEEERLAAIQKQLLYWELQREPVLKRLDVPSKDKCAREKQYIECKTRAANLIGKNQSCLGSEQVGPQASNRSVNSGVSLSRLENSEWRDFQGTLYPEKFCNGQKAQGSCLIELMKNNSVFDSDLDHTVFGGLVHSGLAPAKTVTYPSYRTHDHDGCLQNENHSGVENSPREPQTESECEPEHAVNFSQALVEFTSSGTLFSSLSESLGSSDSGSSFTQNLPVLPTMVTFDIVDVEQEGEGECEQHLEMNTDEDIAASFEAFDDSYVQKESFAECDERMFPGYPHSSFQSCNWGVASLPRHLRLHGLSPSMPAPLSVNRRSRSLDTESLEFELADLQLSKNGLKPCQLWSKRDSSKKDFDGSLLSRSKESTPPSPSDGREADGVLAWPALQCVQYNAECSSGAVTEWGCAPAVVESNWDTSEQSEVDSPFVSLARSNALETLDRRPQDMEPNNPMLQSPRHMVRPSSLPLQIDTRQSQVVSSSYRYHGENMAKKLALVLPLGEKGTDLPQSFSFTQSPEKPAKCKPVGVTQGIPQLHDDNAETLKLPACFAEHYGSPSADLLKGRASHGNPLPISCFLLLHLAGKVEE